MGPIRGLRVRTAGLPAHEVTRAAIPRTAATRTCLDIAREVDLIEAVVALDNARARGRVTATILVEAAHRLTAVPGARRARLATGLADGIGNPVSCTETASGWIDSLPRAGG